MIPLSLLFVVGALVLLGWGLLTTSQILVWGSVVVSLAASASLVVSVLHRRGQTAVAGSGALPAALPVGSSGQASSGSGIVSPVNGTMDLPAQGPPPPADSSTASGLDAADRGTGGASGQPGDPRGPAFAVGAPPPFAGGPPGVPGAADAPPDVPPPFASPPFASPPFASPPVEPRGLNAPADEPPPEDIPIGSALRAAQLADEVIVVDGRPRYHLADCGTLAGRQGVPLPLSAARRTGFTPCSVCRPDSTLLARARGEARS